MSALALLAVVALAQAPTKLELPAGHPRVGDGSRPRSAAEVLEALDRDPALRTGPKPFAIANAMGRLYYEAGRWRDAVPLLRDAIAHAEAARALAPPRPAALPEACRVGTDRVIERALAEARSRAGKGDAAGASACARAALAPALELEVLLGHALFLSGDVKGALAAHERVLSVEPDRDESLYARAAIRLEQEGSSSAAARADLRRLLERRPDSPRAASARALLGAR